jgi:hypothetical protein
MNLVFGSEVALLGFWEYMLRILFRVWRLGAILNLNMPFLSKIQYFHFLLLQLFK